MSRKNVLGLTAGVLALALSGAASAATVTIDGFSDIDGTADGFDAAATAASVAGGLETDANGVVSFNIAQSFSASSTAGSSDLAFDQMGFKITAPDGYYISRILYNEDISGQAGALSAIAATGAVTFGGQTVVLGSFNGFGPVGPASLSFKTGGGTGAELIDVNGAPTELLVAISNTLVTLGDASLSKDNVFFSVEVKPVPVPPALILLGSAIAGLAMVSRKKA